MPAGDEPVITSPDTFREERVPPGQSLTKKLPILHFDGVPPFDPNRWTFTISGLVKEEVRLGYKEFMALPRVKVYADIHCVTGWSKLDNLWEGVSTATIKEVAELRPEAKFVLVHSADGYSTNLSLDDFFEPDVLFAFRLNKAELKPAYGYPLRLVVPRLYFWKSAKWTIGVEFMAKDKPGFWEIRGYHNHGDPWKEERYGAPSNI